MLYFSWRCEPQSCCDGEIVGIDLAYRLCGATLWTRRLRCNKHPQDGAPSCEDRLVRQRVNTIFRCVASGGRRLGPCIANGFLQDFMSWLTPHVDEGSFLSSPTLVNVGIRELEHSHFLSSFSFAFFDLWAPTFLNTNSKSYAVFLF